MYGNGGEYMALKKGALVFDKYSGRYGIRFDVDKYYYSLRCGRCFDVFAGGKWRPTRIEMGSDWYLVDIDTYNFGLDGLMVRINI